MNSQGKHVHLLTVIWALVWGGSGVTEFLFDPNNNLTLTSKQINDAISTISDKKPLTFF